MKIVIITQDDPFYLGKSINYLLKHLPVGIVVKGTVIFDVSPFGKKETFYSKILKTYSIFGILFLIKYGFDYLLNMIDSSTKLTNILSQNNIPIVRLEENINKPESLKIIKNLQPDLLVSIAGNQIFKESLIKLAPKGCINLHTALLPKYRGLMPSFWVLKNNEEETGVSVFFVDEGIDSGPIIVQKRIIIGKMTQSQLIKISKRIGMDAILESINKIQTGNYKLIDNPDGEMSYYSFPTIEDVREFKSIGKRFF